MEGIAVKLSPLNKCEYVPVPLKSLPNSQAISARIAVPIIPEIGATIIQNSKISQGDKSITDILSIRSESVTPI